MHNSCWEPNGFVAHSCGRFLESHSNRALWSEVFQLRFEVITGHKAPDEYGPWTNLVQGSACWPTKFSAIEALISIIMPYCEIFRNSSYVFLQTRSLSFYSTSLWQIWMHQRLVKLIFLKMTPILNNFLKISPILNNSLWTPLMNMEFKEDGFLVPPM